MTANTATANGRPILTPVLANGPPAESLESPDAEPDTAGSLPDEDGPSIVAESLGSVAGSAAWSVAGFDVGLAVDSGEGAALRV